MPRSLFVSSALLAFLFSPLLKAQDLPLARQYFVNTPAVLTSATKVPATPVAGASGSVLVVFRRGASGRVIDARAVGGSGEMQASALASIRQWHFKPTEANGVPAEIVNAASFAYLDGAVTVEPAPPMSTKQMSPTLGFACPNAYAHHDGTAAGLCKQQLEDVEQGRASTDVEQLIAYDEYGLALLDAHQPKAALTEFSEAIKLAAQALQPTDPELAYLYLHRSIAEAQLSDAQDAARDSTSARASMEAVIRGATGAQQAFYRHLEQQFLPPTSESSAAH